MDVRNRRDFLKIAGVAGAGLAAIGLAGCTQSAPVASTGDQASAQGSDSGAPNWEEMDRMHEEGIKAFPAKTEGKGMLPLEPRIEDGVKVFELTCQHIEWEVLPGRKVKAMAYNGMVPGPLIRVTEGDRVRVVVRNELNESTAVHWHGLLVENSQDGVPYITQPPIKPGETYTYNFVAANSGTHMYHSHHNAAIQVASGLLGPLIVDPADGHNYGEDIDYIMVLNDGVLGYTLNGKQFPATEPVVAKKGQKVRIRYIHEGALLHPMHLHGLTMVVVEKDGYPLPMPWKCDTLNIAPGERFDVIVDANNPGIWAFHCHILPHAESQHGMHGMVTVMVVEA